MPADFNVALAVWLKIEGQFTEDAGGTMMGVTQETYRLWCMHRGLPPKNIKQITASEVASVLRDEYWTPLNLGRLIQPWATYCLVQSGNLPWLVAIKIMQGELSWLGYYGGRIDGEVGPQTIDACAQAKTRQDMAIAGCIAHYAAESNPLEFEGFKRRCAMLRQACLEDM